MSKYTIVGESGTVYEFTKCDHSGVHYTAKEDGKLHLCLDDGITFIEGQSRVQYPACNACGKLLAPVLEVSKKVCNHPGIHFEFDDDQKPHLTCDDPTNGLINVDGQKACQKCRKIIYPPANPARLMLNMR